MIDVKHKALLYGFDNLSDIELLSIILNYPKNNVDVLDIASLILTKYESLYNLFNLDLNVLKTIDNINENKAILIKTIYELNKRLNIAKNNESNIKLASSLDIYTRYFNKFLKLNNEVLYVLYLTKNNYLIKEEVMGIGNNDKVIFDYNNLLKNAILNNAKKVILIHNHPSNNVNPSTDDIIMTKRISEALKLVNINLADHLIFTNNQYYSIISNRLWNAQI